MKTKLTKEEFNEYQILASDLCLSTSSKDEGQLGDDEGSYDHIKFKELSERFEKYGIE
jgi:hypothetical protein